MAISLAGHAKSYKTFCFQGHILESISINKERKKIYADLTNGRSNKIFNILIAYEYVTLAPALLFDLKAIPYQRKGLDIFCHEFMRMTRTPDLDPSVRRVPEEEFMPFNWKFYKDRIAEAIKHGNPDEVRQVALEGLRELKKQPDYYCFTRHFLESIYRFAYFTPIREQQAEEMNLKDPTRMMFDVMSLHLIGLKDCHKIDLLSQPIQKMGIPILCSEVPDLLFDLNLPELDSLKRNKE
ncbi:MAG: hypothetical protein ACLGHN_15570 [Bacteriovoracia bacterium]